MNLNKNRYGKLLESLLDREWEKLDKNEIYVPTLDSEALKQNIRGKIRAREKKQFHLKKGLRIAASVVLIASFSTLLYYFVSPKGNVNQVAANEQFIEIVARPGIRKSIVLPDGTKVHLNNASTIRFPEKFGKVSRLVELEGEAFFDVKRDVNHPFIIKSNGVETKVLGTSFNVHSYPGENTVVAVVTGKVQVSVTDIPDSKVFITPGQKATYDINKRTVSRSKTDITKHLAWRYGILDFDGIPVGEAITKIERWYNVKISLEDEELKSRIIQGRYNNESLQNVLKSFKFIHELNIEIKENNEVLIQKKLPM